MRAPRPRQRQANRDHKDARSKLTPQEISTYYEIHKRGRSVWEIAKAIWIQRHTVERILGRDGRTLAELYPRGGAATADATARVALNAAAAPIARCARQSNRAR